MAILASAEEGFAAQKKGEFPAGLEPTLIVSLADPLGQCTPKKLEDELRVEVRWVNRGMVPPTHVWTYESASTSTRDFTESPDLERLVAISAEHQSLIKVPG